MRIFCLLSLLLLIPILLNAQIFHVKDVELNKSNRDQIESKIADFKTVDIPTLEIYKSLQSTSFQKTSIILSFENGKVWNLSIEKNEIRTSDYQFVEIDDSKQSVTELTECKTYRGYLNGDESQYIRLFIDETRFEGYVVDNGEFYFISSMSKFTPSIGDSKFILYKRENILETDGHCGVTEEQEIEFLNNTSKNSGGFQLQRNVPTNCRILEVATEADFEYFQNYGSVNAANNEILNILNQVDGLYQATFNIRIAVVFQRVWTTAGDPYTSAGHGNNEITELRNHWNNNMSNIKRDLVHMFSGKNHGTLLGSVGSNGLGVVCSSLSNSYGFTADRFLAFETTAHEIGHNFGGTHPTNPESGCGTANRTVMCQGTPKVMTFSNFSQNQLNNHINNNQACLLILQNFQINGVPVQPICFNNQDITLNLSHRFLSLNTTWTVGSNLSIIGPSTGNTVTVRTNNIPNNSGLNTWVSATTNLGGACGTIVETANIYLGLPSGIEFSPFMCANTFENFFFTENEMSIAGANSFNYQSLDPSLWISGSGNSVTISVSASGDFPFTMQAVNNCGPSPTTSTFYVTAYNCWGGYSFNAYPNSTSKNLSINIPENFEDSFLEIKLIDGLGEIKKSIVVNTEKSKKVVTLDVSDLKNDFYYLEVKGNNGKQQIRILKAD